TGEPGRSYNCQQCRIYGGAGPRFASSRDFPHARLCRKAGLWRNGGWTTIVQPTGGTGKAGGQPLFLSISTTGVGSHRNPETIVRADPLICPGKNFSRTERTEGRSPGRSPRPAMPAECVLNVRQREGLLCSLNSSLDVFLAMRSA